MGIDRKKNFKYSKRFQILTLPKKIEIPPKTVQHENSVFKKEKYIHVLRRSERGRLLKWREPLPLVDVVEENDETVIVSEFIGFNKDKLRIHIKNQRLTLYTNTFNRRYFKNVILPRKVVPEVTQVKYKNGVLEIRLKKAIEPT
jgi:hypothetical protein